MEHKGSFDIWTVAKRRLCTTDIQVRMVKDDGADDASH